MSTDAFSDKEPATPRPPWKLPEIVELNIELVPFEPPKLQYFTSYTSKYKEAMGLFVRFDGELPARAEVPVLYVGDVAVSESEEVEPGVWCFLAFDYKTLKNGAPVTLGFTGMQPDPKRKGKWRYDPPAHLKKSV